MATERLPLPNLDNLVSVLQDELCAVRKELKESAVAMADKAVRAAQPVMAPLAPTAAAAGSRYVTSSSRMCTPQHWHRCSVCVQEGYFVAFCPIRAEMFCLMQQAG